MSSWRKCAGLPCGSDSKEFACNEGDLGSVPGLGRYSGEGKSYPLKYSGLKNSMDRRAWQVTVHGFAYMNIVLRGMALSPLWRRWPWCVPSSYAWWQSAGCAHSFVIRFQALPCDFQALGWFPVDLQRYLQFTPDRLSPIPCSPVSAAERLRWAPVQCREAKVVRGTKQVLISVHVHVIWSKPQNSRESVCSQRRYQRDGITEKEAKVGPTKGRVKGAC